jgi:hypothetical protein
MLLAEGKIMYFNEAILARQYFANISYVCPDLSNPSDYYMTVLSKESIVVDLIAEGYSPGLLNQEVEKQYGERMNTLITSYDKSELKNDPTTYLEK